MPGTEEKKMKLSVKKYGRLCKITVIIKKYIYIYTINVIIALFHI